MHKTEISSKQMEATIALYLIGSSLLSSGAGEAKQDTWICVILGFALSVPLIWVHSRILELYPGRSYFGNIVRALGGPLGKAVCAVLLIYIFHLAGLVLRIFAEFIHIVNMTDTPLIAISAVVTAVWVYVMSNRLYVMARISKFMFPFLTVTVILTILLSIPIMDPGNLRPVLGSGLKNLTMGTVTSLMLPFSEVLVCAPMFLESDRNESVFPVFFRGALWGFLVLLGADLRNLLVLGYSAGTFLFPSYEAVSIIRLGDFFTRVEVLIGLILLLAGFVKNGVILYTCCDGLREVFRYRDWEPLAGPSALVILTLSELVHSSTEELAGWVPYHIFYVMPFQVLIPVLILIVGKIRKKLEKPGKEKRRPPAPEPRET